MPKSVKVKIPKELKEKIEQGKKEEGKNLRQKKVNKELKRLSRKYQDKTLNGHDLLSVATVEYKDVNTNIERLKMTRGMLENLIPVAEGLYRTRPGQSSAYALTNLLNLYNEVLGGIEASTDYDQIAEAVYEEVFSPFLETIVKTLGQAIKRYSERLAIGRPRSEHDRVKRAFEELYRSFGVSCEEQMAEVKERLRETITGQV